jgi:hypothetical protein
MSPESLRICLWVFFVSMGLAALWQLGWTLLRRRPVDPPRTWPGRIWRFLVGTLQGTFLLVGLVLISYPTWKPELWLVEGHAEVNQGSSFGNLFSPRMPARTGSLQVPPSYIDPTLVDAQLDWRVDASGRRLAYLLALCLLAMLGYAIRRALQRRLRLTTRKVLVVIILFGLFCWCATASVQCSARGYLRWDGPLDAPAVLAELCSPELARAYEQDLADEPRPIPYAELLETIEITGERITYQHTWRRHAPGAPGLYQLRRLMELHAILVSGRRRAWTPAQLDALREERILPEALAPLLEEDGENQEEE